MYRYRKRHMYVFRPIIFDTYKPFGMSIIQHISLLDSIVY